MRSLPLVVLIAACRPMPKTVGDACDDVIDAICDRDTECGLLKQRGDCLTAEFLADCCARKHICTGPASDPHAAVACADGIRQVACTDIADKRVPGYCATAIDVRDAFTAAP